MDRLISVLKELCSVEILSHQRLTRLVPMKPEHLLPIALISAEIAELFIETPGYATLQNCRAMVSHHRDAIMYLHQSVILTVPLQYEQRGNLQRHEGSTRRKSLFLDDLGGFKYKSGSPCYVCCQVRYHVCCHVYYHVYYYGYCHATL